MKLSNSAKTILNDPIRIERRDKWFERLRSLFSGNYSGDAPSISGICGYPRDGKLVYSCPEQWVVESLENLAEKIDRYDDEAHFVPHCIQLDLFGVHYVDSFFGAHVYYNNEAFQWYNDYLTGDIGSLSFPDFEQHEAWDISKRAVQAFLEQEVALPVFGLPTISSALNIAVNLYGQKILLEMMLEPDNAAHDFMVINKLLVELHSRFRSALGEKQLQPVLPWERGQPPGYGQLCGCSSQLLGADLYRDFIAPLDNELLGVYPHGGMIHLCGSHRQLIPVFRSMQNLKTVQVNDDAARDLEPYFTGLREDQIIYYMPCEGMPVEKALLITGGKRLVIQDKVSF